MTRGATFRTVAGSGIYLGVLAVFSLGVGAVLRHTAGAITAGLALLLAPVIAIGFLPESVVEWVEKVSPMPARVAIQQSVHDADSLPLGPWVGLGVVGAYAATALLIALLLISKRDA